MKERPILFSGPMVRAILEGRKTQTRRAINFDRNPNRYGGVPGNAYDSKGYCAVTDHNIQCVPWTRENIEQLLVCPYGVPGDRLWVRETGWWIRKGESGAEFDDVAYKADCDVHPYTHNHWRSPVFMPRWASRLTLEIVKVRVERVQDISEDDAEAEGSGHCDICNDSNTNSRGDDTCPANCGQLSYREEFSRLWDSINGKKHPWSQNPWVWVLEFKKVD